MFFFLLYLINSYFLSPEFDNSISLIPVSSVDKIYDIVNKTKITFLLACEVGDGMLSETFFSLKEIFPEFEYVYTDENVLNEIYHKEKMIPPILPALVVFEHGTIFTAVSQIENPNQLLFLVDLYGNQKTPFIDQPLQIKILQNIGHAPITIITTPQNFSKIFKLTKFESPKLGPISIVQISKENLRQTNIFNPDRPSVFRSLDGQIQPFDIYSTRSFVEAATSSFQRGTLANIRKERKDIFAFYSPILHSFLKELLFVVGQQLRPIGFSVYYVSTQNVAQEIKGITNGFDISKNGMGFAIFNAHHNYFYNVSQFQPPKEFANGQAWADCISKAVIAYQEKRIKREYRTEKSINISKNTRDKLIRLSAENYKDFQNLEGVDTVVLYIKNTIKECLNYFPDYYDLSNDVFSRGFNSLIKFGYLDIGKNGLPGPLPDDSELPYVEFYPANNKSNPVRSYVHHPTINDIILLLKAYSSIHFPIAANIPPKEKFLKLKNDIKKNMTKASSKEKNKALDFISRLEEMYGDKKDYFMHEIWSINDLDENKEAETPTIQEAETPTIQEASNSTEL